MADMRFVLPGSDTVTLSGQTVDKLIRAGDGTAVLLYLYAARTGGALSVSQAAKTFSRSEQDVSASMELLSRLGLMKCDDAPPPVRKEELPDYTAEDIKNELSSGSVFHALVQEVQRSLGKILSSDDLIKLFGIYDSLGLPPEVILQLVTYCIDDNRRRYGPGRVPTMRYIEKAAFTWEREGIMTLDAAEQYIKIMDSRKNLVSDIKKVLQIKDRELSQSEKKYVDTWLAMGFSPEAVELAYDKTLVKTGRLAWSYMDSILGSWHQKGLHSVDDIQAKDGKGEKPAGKRPFAPPVRASAPSPSEVAHMKKFLEKLREE
jgi:DnaD/phage-associated family protein